MICWLNALKCIKRDNKARIYDHFAQLANADNFHYKLIALFSSSLDALSAVSMSFEFLRVSGGTARSKHKRRDVKYLITQFRQLETCKFLNVSYSIFKLIRKICSKK